jgi:hypothetical protein
VLRDAAIWSMRGTRLSFSAASRSCRATADLGIRAIAVSQRHIHGDLGRGDQAGDRMRSARSGYGERHMRMAAGRPVFCTA